MKKSLLHAFCIWLFVYPIVTALMFGIQQMNLPIPLGVKSMMMSLILVPLMYFFIVPLVHRLLTNIRC